MVIIKNYKVKYNYLTNIRKDWKTFPNSQPSDVGREVLFPTSDGVWRGGNFGILFVEMLHFGAFYALLNKIYTCQHARGISLLNTALDS